MVTELSDVDILKNVLNIGRRRERAIYYRPDGTPTLPLPADPYNKIYYLSKGFRLKPQKTNEPVVAGKGMVQTLSDGLIHCPMPGCTFTTEKPLGLRSHLRVHITNEKEE